MLNLNLILSDNTMDIKDKILKNLENQVFLDEENEIFDLNEEFSVQQYIKNMTIITASNENTKDGFDVIREIISDIIKRFQNRR